MDKDTANKLKGCKTIEDMFKVILKEYDCTQPLGLVNHSIIWTGLRRGIDMVKPPKK